MLQFCPVTDALHLLELVKLCKTGEEKTDNNPLGVL